MTHRKALVLIIVLTAALLAIPLAAKAETTSDGPDEAKDSATAVSSSEEETESNQGGEELHSFYATTTVTATGSEREVFDVSTPVTVLESQRIEERLPENPVDLLRDQPGVDVNGVGPNQARPIIRGQRGLRVLFMENGLRMNNARRQTDFGEIPGLIDLDSVQAVEIVRGPASVLYGTDAIGGVLNLVSKVPAFGDGSWVAGSFGLRYATASDQARVNFFVDGRHHKLSYNLGITSRDASDYDAPSGSFGDITLTDDTRVNDTALTDDSIFGFLAYDLGDRHQLTFRFNRYRAEQAGFGFVDPAAYGGDEDFFLRILYPFQDFDRYTVGYVGSVLDWGVADSADARLYYQDNEREFANDIDLNIGPIFPGAPDSSVEIDTLNFTDLETWGTRAQLIKVAGDRHILTYGAELFQDDSFNTDSSTTLTTIRFPFPPFEFPILATDDVANAPNAENTSYGVFLQDEIKATDRLLVTLGARYQNVETKAKPTPGWDITGLDFDDDTLVGTINLIYYLTDNLNLLGSYGTAFRAPNIIERLFNGPTPEGNGFQILNPDLVSEESDNFDVGLKYQRRNAMFELIFFRNEIDNGIIQHFLSPEEIAALPPELQNEIVDSRVQFVVQQRNIDQLRIDGVEAIVAYRWNNGLSLGGNYTDLDGERVDSLQPPTGDTVNEKYSAYFRYDQPGGRFWVEYRLRHNGSQPSTLDPNAPIPPVGATLPSFTVHTLGGGVTLWERGRQQHRLGVVIDNLTDELYAEFSNSSFFRPQPEQNVIVSYRVKF